MAQATWKKVAASPSIQRSSQTLAVIANKAYIYGGELHPREPVDAGVYTCTLDVDSPKPRVSPISLTKSQPQPRVGAASTSLNGKLYIFSGRGGTAMAPIEEHGSFWVLDPSTNTWSQLTPEDHGSPFPAGRSYHAMGNDGHDTIFLHAGCPENGRLSDVWAFNVSTRQWRELPPAPGAARGGTSMTYADRKLFRMNGFDGKTELGGAVDVFDPASNSWSTISYTADGVSGPTPRSVSCLLPVKVEGRWSLLTAFGESAPSNLGHQGAGKMLSDVWVFDLKSEVWSKVQMDGHDTPVARGWFGADALNDGAHSSIVVHGGLGGSNERLEDVWMLQF